MFCVIDTRFKLPFDDGRMMPQSMIQQKDQLRDLVRSNNNNKCLEKTNESYKWEKVYHSLLCVCRSSVVTWVIRTCNCCLALHTQFTSELLLVRTCTQSHHEICLIYYELDVAFMSCCVSRWFGSRMIDLIDETIYFGIYFHMIWLVMAWHAQRMQHKIV